jgi:Lon protease-like protein
MPEIPLFLLNTVLFPEMVLPLQIFEERYKIMVRRCLERSEPFGVVLIRSGKEVGETAEPFAVGTTARISEAKHLDDGRMNLIAVGERRFRVRSLRRDEPYLVGEVETAVLERDSEDEPAELGDRVSALFAEYYRLQVYLQGNWERTLNLPSDRERLAYAVAAGMELEPLVKQDLLEMDALSTILSRENDLLGEAIPAMTARLAAARRQRFGRLGVLN